jgi:hypothetical protein
MKYLYLKEIIKKWISFIRDIDYPTSLEENPRLQIQFQNKDVQDMSDKEIKELCSLSPLAKALKNMEKVKLEKEDNPYYIMKSNNKKK